MKEDSPLCSLRLRAAGIVAAVVLAAAPASSLAIPVDSPRAVAAHKCSASYTHAVMPDGGHKCLRAGQFCSHQRGWQRVYHRHGFHCKRNGQLRNY
jgi:hypothetical protein